MHLHPAITALRDTHVLQRRAIAEAGAAMRRARDMARVSDPVAGVMEDLERFGSGALLTSCVELSRVMHDAEEALCLARSALGETLDALTMHMFGEAAFPYRVAEGVSTLQIGKSGRATLNLVAYEPIEAYRAPQTALFTDRETVELVVTGSAIGLLHERPANNALHTMRCRWDVGDQISTTPLESTRQVLRAERSTLWLQLTRDPARARPTCEIDIDSGKVLRQASGDKSASQAVMALGVLGALNASDALDVMQATALNCEEDTEVRWEALRQALGLSSERGFAILNTLITRENEPLKQPARALRDHLLARQPDLHQLA